MSGNVVVGYRTDATTAGIGVDVTPATPLPVTISGGTPSAPGYVSEVPTTQSAAGLTSVKSAALETGHIIKASAGNLYGFNGATTTVAGFFLIHNSATVPAAGAVTPVKAYPVAAGQAIEVGFDPPIRFSTGISISFSSATTPFTQTDSATAFISGDAA